MQENSVEAPHRTPAQCKFYASEQCLSAREALKNMVGDQHYGTNSKYYQQSALGFIERHLHYLSLHPTVNVNGYLSNLKLMTRKRI